MGKHFLFASTMGHGHVNPTLPVVRELVGRGHRVTYATQKAFAAAVESAGATLLPTSGQPPTYVGPDSVRWQKEFIDMARTDLPLLLAHAQQDQLDAVCFDRMAPAAGMVAEKLGLPDIALVPNFATNDRFSMRPYFAAAGPGPVISTLEETRRLREGFAAEQGVRTFGAPEGGASLNIVFIPREFQMEADTFDERFRFVGPSLDGKRMFGGQWQPPGNGKPLLFVSMGTAYNNRPEFFRMCLDAFADGEWQVVIAVGEHIDPAWLGPVPDNIEIRPYFPQLAVLGHADVFLSHAGMNSVMESLSVAVPLVTVEQMTEQELNARRVAELGLGRRLDPADLTPDLLRTAVTEVGADEEIRANLADMSKALREAGGAVAAADAIEAFVAR
ncbi:macrolide family glycosyltransferase [Streptomyces shenzhenensis]|uniref:macrolide family glycosyltransferase n=1 Tax=Streptomyces shenzhenensis TaxID=943815 RepID=UPI001C68C6B3|nr:macrolide family glycosyltransferase [Streptomyces shenzhenensis]